MKMNSYTKLFTPSMENQGLHGSVTQLSQEYDVQPFMGTGNLPSSAFHVANME